MASVVLSWTPAGGLVTSQKVYRGLDPGSLSLIATLAASVNKYTDSSVSANTQYFYMVQSVCSSGGPEDSLVVTVTTQQATAVNLLVIPNAPPQQNSDNILETVQMVSSFLNNFNPIGNSWSVMGWFRMDHTVQELNQTSSEDTADTVLFAVEEDYDTIEQNPSGYDRGHVVIYREASTSGDYITVEIQDNNSNKIKYQYLLSSGSNNSITGITGPFPAVYWDSTVQGNNGLIHIGVTYDPLASLLVNRVKVYWNGQELTISSVPYNSAPSEQAWVSTSKRFTLGWASEISSGYSGHSVKMSIDELGFYNSTLSLNSVLNGYNTGIIDVQSNHPSLSPDLEWSFEQDGSENSSIAGAEFNFSNPGGVQPYDQGPYVFPANQPIPQ